MQMGFAIPSKGKKHRGESDGDKQKPREVLNVEVVGPKGRQKLFISVSMENGGLIADAEGVLIDGLISKEFTTGQSGIYVHEVKFDGNEPTRVIRVKIGDGPIHNWESVIMNTKPPRLQLSPITAELERRFPV